MGQPSDADTDVSDTDAAATVPPPPPSLSLGTCGLKVTHAIGVCQFVFVRYAHELVRIVVTSGGCYPGRCLRDLFRRLPPDPALVAARSRLVVAVTPCPFGWNRWLALLVVGVLRALRAVTARVARIFGVVDASDALPPALAALTAPSGAGVRLVDGFASMDELLDAAMCSMHIPPLFRNPTPRMRRCLDGGFGGGSGAPRLDARTVTVQPDAAADVPSDAAASWVDALTLAQLRPQRTLDVARAECAAGFEAARRRTRVSRASRARGRAKVANPGRRSSREEHTRK
ncbi:hypothetical protein JL721_9944 [Aureococcus anophagefferens]|nr:hypothetical protein JL721_9944 [Aureococcus anophagefferens]